MVLLSSSPDEGDTVLGDEDAAVGKALFASAIEALSNKTSPGPMGSVIHNDNVETAIGFVTYSTPSAITNSVRGS